MDLPVIDCHAEEEGESDFEISPEKGTYDIDVNSPLKDSKIEEIPDVSIGQNYSFYRLKKALNQRKMRQDYEQFRANIC